MAIGQKLKLIGKATAAVMAALIQPQVGRDELADAVGYIENAGTPGSVTPDFIGQWLFDTTGSTWYRSFGVSSGNWLPMGDDSLSLTELAFLDGATAGTVVASKAVVVDANSHIDTLGIAASGLKIGVSGSETTVTASGAELNFLAGVSAGTGAASKAMVLGAGSFAMPAGLYFNFSVSALAAAGSGQSTYAAISSQLNGVTGADGTKGVALPAANAGRPILVVNTSATSPLFVSPVNAGDDAINGLTAGTGVYELGPGESAWFMATSSTQWYAIKSHNRFNAELVTATNVITADESGKTYFLNSATEFVSTLPAPAAGLRYTFIVKAAPSGASYTIVTNGSANIIVGNQNSVAGDAGDFGTTDDTISFVDGQSVAGDKVELYCDGTLWYAYAISKVAAGITFTTAS